MRPATASRLARLAPVLVVSALLLGACVATAAPGWTFAPPPSVASPAASAGGSAAPSGSTAPSGSGAPSASASAAASPSASASASASAAASAAASASPSSGGAGGTSVNVSATNIAFDQKEIEAPAGQPFHIAFTNNDASTQHNIQITAPDGTQPFKGALFTGPGTTTYDVPALPAGAYTFSCVVHPSMTGTLTVK